MEKIIDEVRNFVHRKVIPSAEYYDQNNIYPVELIEIMKSIGLFGLNIPQAYEGLEYDISTRLRVIIELSSGWVSLCAILDSHLRVCDYIIQFGTDQQKAKYLPLLAKGKLIAAHANNEKNQKILENYETCLINIDSSYKTWMLSGRKEWVTNSVNADIYAVSARLLTNNEYLKSINSCVVLLEKNHVGLKANQDWHRMGAKGVSLGPVILDQCVVETKNIIGEFHYNGRTLVDSSHKNLMMVSSARAIGVARKIIDKLLLFIIERKRNGIIGSLAEEPVLRFRIGELVAKFQAAEAFFNECFLNLDSADNSKFMSCKVFVTDATKSICLSSLQIFGGSGYTSEFDVERYIRDALSLLIIHTPNDISLTRLGQLALENIKLKQENPTSILLHYAPIVLPYINRQFLLETTLQENERIIDAGYYLDTNIKLYLYDMTTLSPSSTFKDFLGCLTYAYCLQNKIDCICAQSSGNTAMSLIHYARKNPSIKLIQFYITRNAHKINPAFVPFNVILVEVNSTETEMKRILKRFSDVTGIPVMPTLKIQIDANKTRAYFLKDYCIQNRIPFHWYAQSLSSAYGPIGLYHGFQDIGGTVSLPKLLGVQQQAVCPFARKLGFWHGSNEKDEGVEIIEPTLFRTEPGELVDKVKNILDTWGGKIKVVTNQTFNQYLDEAITLLAKNNIYITKTITGNVYEKSGILALTAILHEINSDNHGVFSPNENILIGITGGTGCPASRKPKPRQVLNENPTDEQLKQILEYL